MRNYYSIEIPWSDFKAFLTRTAVPYYWAQATGECYYVLAQQGCLTLKAEILITTPANADQVDFETTYKK